MKTIKKTIIRRSLVILAMTLISSNLFAQEIEFNKQDEQLILDNPDLVIWHVKALTNKSEILNVKAVDENGNFHPVKALQETENFQILDVKAFINGEPLPVKLLPKENARYYPLKVIRKDGTLLDIKALTASGELMDVVGVIQYGNVVHIRAVDPKGDLYSLIAVSPNGRSNVVSGIKMMKEDIETEVNGIPIFSHVKAITQ